MPVLVIHLTGQYMLNLMIQYLKHCTEILVLLRNLDNVHPSLLQLRHSRIVLNVYYGSEGPISAQAGFYSYSTQFLGLHPGIFES